VTEIHQILVGAGQTDAITNMARSLRQTLQTLGPSGIYAQHPAPDVIDVQHLNELSRHHTASRVLIFHASGGDPEVFKFLKSSTDPIILIFHNIAPSELFENFDSERAALLKRGWEELAELRPKISLSIADSKYNASCLEEIGYRNVEVLPIGITPNRLHSCKTDQTLEQLLKREAPGPLLLYVGQAVPHKRPEVLVQMQYLLSHHIGRTTSLALVGPPTMPQVNAVALEQARRLRVRGCLFLGQINENELATLYRKASVFVTASTHEGLCLPVIEAMSFGVPSVARRTAALPDTLKDAGILLPETAGPELFAEAVGELLDNPQLSTQLSNRGKRRAATYSSTSTSESFLSLLKQVSP
jgi:L-malate glycosyltransferase